MIIKHKIKIAAYLFILGISLSACNTSTPPTAEPATLAVTQHAEPKPVMMGAFLSSTAGQNLQESDRQLAYNAQIQAASSGKRAQWRAQKSDAYGYVEASNSQSSPSCKTYQHVIYAKGRSTRGSGEICQSAAGNWEIVN